MRAKYGLYACVSVFVCWVALASDAGGDTILITRDTNCDGKVDRWRTVVDNDITSELLDTNQDAKADRLHIYGQRDGKRRIVEEWIDSNYDGSYNLLRRLGEGDTRETWTQVKRDGWEYIRYWKRDAKQETTGKTTRLGCTVITDVTTGPIRRIRIFQRQIGKTIHATFENDAPRRVLYNPEPGIVIELTEFTGLSSFPGRVLWSGPKAPQPMAVVDSNHDGIPNYMTYPEMKQGKKQDSRVYAKDRNDDGRFDEFTFLTKTMREVKRDDDFDGLLDCVEMQTTDGKVVVGTLTAEEISVRSLPNVVAAPYDQVIAILAEVEVEAEKIRAELREEKAPNEP